VFRRIEFAIGFTDGTWSEASILVPEPYDNAMTEDEVRERAEEMMEKFEFSDKEIAFRTILFIEDPEGGYDDDRW
jgi:hypothetical protein